MKLRLLILTVLCAAWVAAAAPQRTAGPLTKDEVMTLVKFGMNSSDLAKKIKSLGIDFEPKEDYLNALRQAGAPDEVLQALRNLRPAPLTRDQLGKLVAGGVPNERAAALVQQRGVDFLADEEYLKTLRLAGADDALIAAVRAASASVLGELALHTSPHAEVSLDGARLGVADGQGEFTWKAPLGPHTLKVTLAGKKNFEQSIQLTGVQPAKIEARLEGSQGAVVVHTSPGADVFMDGQRLGTADMSGKLLVPEETPGPHDLRITAPRKQEYRHNITVVAGEQTAVEALLADQAPAASGVINLAGTYWDSTEVQGGHYEYHFREDGVLDYKTPSGSYTNGTWKQDGNSIYMETNHKYSERQGTITGNHIEGKGWNVKGLRWTWRAEKKP